MFNLRFVAAGLAALSIIGAATGHPGEVHTAEEIQRDIAQHKTQQVKARRSLGGCANSASAVALKTRAVSRRAAMAQTLRENRGLTKS